MDRRRGAMKGRSPSPGCPLFASFQCERVKEKRSHIAGKPDFPTITTNCTITLLCLSHRRLAHCQLQSNHYTIVHLGLTTLPLRTLVRPRFAYIDFTPICCTLPCLSPFSAGDSDTKARALRSATLDLRLPCFRIARSRRS